MNEEIRSYEVVKTPDPMSAGYKFYCVDHKRGLITDSYRNSNQAIKQMQDLIDEHD